MTDHAEERLAALEAEYHASLVSALKECAAGSWGLFGHNEHLDGRLKPSKWVGELADLARPINRERQRVGLGPFVLHERFESSRGPADANAPGEPKKAKAWLAELGEQVCHPPFRSFTTTA